MTFCKHQHPNIVTYAVTSGNDELRSRVARGLGGCKGFFYLEDGHMQIDMTRGVAAQLLIGKTLATRRSHLLSTYRKMISQQINLRESSLEKEQRSGFNGHTIQKQRK